MLIWTVIVVVGAFLAYVRLAPSDPVRWHKAAAASGIETKTLKGGYIWRKAVAGDGKAELQALADAASQTPRTQVLAGSLEAGQITYITRSQVIGFPDYSTVGLYQTADGQSYLEVYARLRFGRSDLGVNAKRVKLWLTALK